MDVYDLPNVCADYTAKYLPAFQPYFLPHTRETNRLLCNGEPPPPSTSTFDYSRPLYDPNYNKQAQLNRTTSSRLGDKTTHYLYVNKVFCQHLKFLSQGSGAGTSLKNRCKKSYSVQIQVVWERREPRFNRIWPEGAYRFGCTNCTHYPKIILRHTWGNGKTSSGHLLKLHKLYWWLLPQVTPHWIILFIKTSLKLCPWEPHMCLPHSTLRNTSASLFVWPSHHQSEFNTSESSEGLWWLKTTFSEDFLPVTSNDYELGTLLTMFIEKR